MRKLTLCAALCLVACGGGNKDSGRSTTPENASQQAPSSETQTTSSNYTDNQTPPPSTSTETAMPTTNPQTANSWQQTPGSMQSTTRSTGTTPSTGTTTTTGGSVGTTGGGTSGAGSTSNLSDEQIVAITTAANTGEIQQAQLVKDRTQNAQIRKFAEHMIHDHGQLKADGQKLVTKLKLTPQDNQMSLQLTSDSKQLVDTLRGEKGAQFDKDYIDAQVKEHRDLLDALDNKMIPQAQNAEIKTALQNARTKVEAHLKLAEDIQKNLGNKP
jgi:putative membrane protein